MLLTQARSYDIIVFGDEVPGILALVSAAREYKRRKNAFPRCLLLFKGNSQLGIGGHLVRGGLSYLDRSSVPSRIRQENHLGTFGDPPAIYKEFLQKAGVREQFIALDPQKASDALEKMRSEVNADILSNIEIESVIKEEQKISGIHLTNGETYNARVFIDCTVNAELAQAAGVRKLKGFKTFGLPDSELCVTLTFQTIGLSIETLKEVEKRYLERFTNLADQEAQNWLKIAAAENPQFRDSKGNLNTMFVGEDYIYIRSKALSIAYHSFRGTSLSLEDSGAILDNGNIAILASDVLSWNALLFSVNADEAESLARAKAQPTPKMLEEMDSVAEWFKSIGAKVVKPASELYIRHAGNVTGVVDPLTGAQMLAGGVPATEALGTFGYNFDVRGGIKDLGKRVRKEILDNLSSFKPLFNIGIQHALVQDVPNLAVVSPGSGFEGFASSNGRIVEFNCGVGQGVGIASAVALLSNRNLANVSNQEVHDILQKTGKLSKIYGQTYTAQAQQLNEIEQPVPV